MTHHKRGELKGPSQDKEVNSWTEIEKDPFQEQDNVWGPESQGLVHQRNTARMIPNKSPMNL